MYRKSKPRFLSFLICLILLIAHFNAITANAAPLSNNDSKKVITAIQNTEQGNSDKLYSNLTGGSTVYIRSFEITNVEAPKTGRLLDDTATVVADNGVTWDIPVIWVNKDGDIIHIAIEIDDVVRSYPIFVFYMPEGYSLLFGEKSAYNIGMPDFVAALMKRNGITALSIPDAGRTYISALLPNTTNFKLNIPPATVDEESSSANDAGSKEAEGPPGSNSGGSSGGGSHLTPPTDNDTTPPDPGLTEEEKIQVTDAHCSQDAIDLLGVDKLSALVTWVKYTLEPEAANLLASKFPAYKNAAANNELGESIGLYIYYDDSSSAMAAVETRSTSTAEVSYRVSVNAAYFYEYDSTLGDYVFDGTTNYSDLDNTLVHEMMHAYMEDYCRTGMQGIQYNETTSSYIIDRGSSGIEFPSWFVEGTASSVDNTYQFRNNTIKNLYGYDDDQSSDTYNTYVSDDLKASYCSASSDINITGNSTPSKYITGYLATIYLSYLAAKSSGKEAISGDRIDSSVILYGENYILESLHNGSTLDEVISTISNSMYADTADFEENFILDVDGTDGGKSLEFCTKLLNYLQQSSTDDTTANGSILLDFSDTNTAQLHKSLLNQTQTVYIPTDDKNYATSTVDRDDALNSGGTSVPGIVNKNGKEGSSTSEADTHTNHESAEYAAKEASNEDNLDCVKEQDFTKTADIPIEESSSNAPISSIAEAISIALTPDNQSEGKPVIESENSTDKDLDSANTSEPEVSETELSPAANPSTIDGATTQEESSTTSQETIQADSSTAPNDESRDHTPCTSSDQTNSSSTDNQIDCISASDSLNDSENNTTTNQDNTDSTEPQDTANADSSATVDDTGTTPTPVLEVTITEDPSAEPISNPIIISEAETEESQSDTDDNSSEQVLDVIPEEPSHNDEEINKELLTK